MDRDSCGPVFSIDRRTLIAGASTIPFLPSLAFAQSGGPFSDAHAHFFNASDLPIAGFAKYDLMPEWLGNNPAVAALVDFFAYFIQPRAKTAEWELRHLGGGEEAAYLTFGRDAARFVSGRMKGAPNAALMSQGVDRAELASSYKALRSALIADAGYPAEMMPQLLKSRADERSVDEMIFREVARKADEQDPWGPGEIAEYKSLSTTSPPSLAPDTMSVWGIIARAVGWGYLMLKRRESHLKEYLGRNGAPGFSPNVLVNHLVDYDLWIDDAPAQGSSHGAQIEFWNALAQHAKSWPRAVDLRTFAGFCPLKLAVQKRRGEAPWFSSLKQLRAAGKFTGFKLYPPMGFRPIGNSSLQDTEFDTGGAARVSALDQWRKVAGASEPLGPRLDDALGEFYAYCADNHVPIMAHSRRSNGTAPNYDQRADPHLWKQVTDKWPIRLLLGHSITGAKKFVEAEPNGEEDAAWPLDATIAMLTNPNFGSGPQVYGDLGYMPDLLASPTLARDFFVKLKQLFGPVGLKRICYGTDWIMLAREKNNREYLSALVNGMKAANFTPSEQADILENNVRRFLGS